MSKNGRKITLVVDMEAEVEPIGPLTIHHSEDLLAHVVAHLQEIAEAEMTAEVEIADMVVGETIEGDDAPSIFNLIHFLMN